MFAHHPLEMGSHLQHTRAGVEPIHVVEVVQHTLLPRPLLALFRFRVVCERTRRVSAAMVGTWLDDLNP